ncbi:hypothetical protein D3C75_1139540 [compost metagenome]
MRKDGNQSQYEDKRAPVVKHLCLLHSFRRILHILVRAKRYENENGANDRYDALFFLISHAVPPLQNN